MYTFIRVLLINQRPLPEDRKIFWEHIINGDPEVEKPRVSLTSYEKNLQSMNQLIHKKGIKSIHLLLPTNRNFPQPEDGIKYRDVSKRIAKAYQAEIIDMDDFFNEYTEKELRVRFMDVVHPNTKGHQEIAEQICTSVREIE